MTSETTGMIAIASIDTSDRLRGLDPDWVALLAEEIALDGLVEPIRVVARGNGYRLIKGARRIAAHRTLGRDEIAAYVVPEDVLADDAAVRLAEIKATMLRGDLTALDRAVYVAAWCEIHQAVHGKPKRGRKADDGGFADSLDEMSVKLTQNWSEAAQQALGVSRKGIYRALSIARIAVELRRRIALHPIANTQRELLLLAELTPVRQAAVVDLLTSEPAQAISVTEAIALLDSVPTPRPVPAYERIHERFAKLPVPEQERFFALSADAIEVWLAKRAAKARKAA